jgi:hypothetical protein
MSITHEEARRLIQSQEDDALKGVEMSVLAAHLNICRECQKYADSINELDSTLRPLLERKWNSYPLPHSIGHVISRRSNRLAQSIFFATRIAAMGVICIAFLFNIWQFTQSGGKGTNPPSADIPLIPTPSMQSATPKVMGQQCGPIVYKVRKNDTLESIAAQFSISTDEIIQVNHLRTATLNTSMKLSIHDCSPTPPRMAKTVTTTFTPLLGTTTLTPVDSPTQ